MKRLIFLISILISFTPEAQNQNWLLKDKECITNPSLSSIAYSPFPGVTSNIEIIGKSHPNRAFPYPYDGAPRNDIFIIFDDGTYFNSRYIYGSNWVDGVDIHQPSAPTNGNSDYSLRLDQEMSFLYFTDVYEGDDDPPARIQPIGTSLTQLFDFQVGNSPTLSHSLTPLNQVITSNHSPVPGKDLTLIIDHKFIEKECNYKLCYDTIVDPDDGVAPRIEASNIFNSSQDFIASGNGSTLIPRAYDFSNYCTDTISFNGSELFTYINLHIPDDPDSMISHKVITFKLIPTTPRCSITHFFQDTIGTSHDPNYIQVLCVNRPEIGDSSTIHYRAQCLNDGDDIQPNPSIEFTFPFNISINDITVTKSSIAKTSLGNGFNNQSPDVISNGNNRVKFEFSGTLDFCPIPSERDLCKAWVEFCLKVHNDEVNVLSDPLKPFNRNTNFGIKKYAIERFIDIDCVDCEDDEPRSTIEQRLLYPVHLNYRGERFYANDLKKNCCRPNTICDCTFKEPEDPKCTVCCNDNVNFNKLCCLFGILILILLLLILFKKSKN